MKKVKITKAEALTYLDMGKDVTSLFLYRVLNSLRWKTSPDPPEPPVRLSLADLPVGYNLAGKTIVFTNTDLPLYFPAEWGSKTLQTRGSDPAILFGRGEIGQGQIIILTGMSLTTFMIYMEDQGWLTKEVTLCTVEELVNEFGEKEDALVVVENNLPRSSTGIWGFDYAYVTDL